MDEYKEPYLILWRGCTAAIKAITEQNDDLAKYILLQAQRAAEESYIEGGTSSNCEKSLE